MRVRQAVYPVRQRRERQDILLGHGVRRVGCAGTDTDQSAYRRGGSRGPDRAGYPCSGGTGPCLDRQLFVGDPVLCGAELQWRAGVRRQCSTAAVCDAGAVHAGAVGARYAAAGAGI